MTTNVVLFALLVALQVADAATTIRIIQRGGHELNPLLNRFMSNLGVRVALLVSKLFALGVVALVWYMNLLPGWGITGLLALACALFIWVVMHNLEQLRK